MHEFKADIAILLNITPDHLDRYENNFQKYLESKFQILNNQGTTETFIFNIDDSVIEDEIKTRNIKSSLFPFSQNRKLTKGSWLENEQILINIKNKQTDIQINYTKILTKNSKYIMK